MGDTSIEWTDKTWNPVTGCTKVSQGCKNCYAERVFPRAYGTLRKFTDVVSHDNRLEQPLRWRKPARIFVNSMSDLFHDEVSEEFITKVFGIMAAAEWHQFQILTKRPLRMLRYIESHKRTLSLMSEVWPLPNIWLGVSVEDQGTADERIPLLLQTAAAIHFVSYEPALGPVRFNSIRILAGHLAGEVGARIDWLIGGSESGPNARDYSTEWFESAARYCKEAKTAFFMKQLTLRGRKIPFEQWPGYLQVRQFPQEVLPFAEVQR